MDTTSNENVGFQAPGEQPDAPKPAQIPLGFLLGVFFSCIGLGIIFAQGYQFFQLFTERRFRPMKIMVACVILLQIAQTSADFSRMLKIFCIHFGDQAYFIAVRPEDAIAPFLGVVSQAQCQIYLLYRAWKWSRVAGGWWWTGWNTSNGGGKGGGGVITPGSLEKGTFNGKFADYDGGKIKGNGFSIWRLFKRVIFVVFGVGGILASMATGFASSLIVIVIASFARMVKSNPEFVFMRRMSTGWMLTAVLIDLALAALLITELSHTKRRLCQTQIQQQQPVKKHRGLRFPIPITLDRSRAGAEDQGVASIGNRSLASLHTENLVNRLLILTVKTGVLVALLQLWALINWVVDTYSADNAIVWSYLTIMFIPKAYTGTFLAVIINSRSATESSKLGTGNGNGRRCEMSSGGDPYTTLRLDGKGHATSRRSRSRNSSDELAATLGGSDSRHWTGETTLVPDSSSGRSELTWTGKKLPPSLSTTAIAFPVVKSTSPQSANFGPISEPSPPHSQTTFNRSGSSTPNLPPPVPALCNPEPATTYDMFSALSFGPLPRLSTIEEERSGASTTASIHRRDSTTFSEQEEQTLAPIDDTVEDEELQKRLRQVEKTAFMLDPPPPGRAKSWMDFDSDEESERKSSFMRRKSKSSSFRSNFKRRQSDDRKRREIYHNHIWSDPPNFITIGRSSTDSDVIHSPSKTRSNSASSEPPFPDTQFSPRPSRPDNTSYLRSQRLGRPPSLSFRSRSQAECALSPIPSHGQSIAPESVSDPQLSPQTPRAANRLEPPNSGFPKSEVKPFVRSWSPRGAFGELARQQGVNLSLSKERSKPGLLVDPAFTFGQSDPPHHAPSKTPSFGGHIKNSSSSSSSSSSPTSPYYTPPYLSGSTPRMLAFERSPRSIDPQLAELLKDDGSGSFAASSVWTSATGRFNQEQPKQSQSQETERSGSIISSATTDTFGCADRSRPDLLAALAENEHAEVQDENDEERSVRFPSMSDDYY